LYTIYDPIEIIAILNNSAAIPLTHAAGYNSTLGLRKVK